MLDKELSSAAEKDVGLKAYENLKIYTLQKHGLPEEQLPFSDCVTVEYFRDVYGKDRLSDNEAQNYKYVVYVRENCCVLKHACFNNIKEFEEACGKLNDFFAGEKKETGFVKNRRERQLVELYKAINNLRELASKKVKRVWTHFSEEDKGAINLAGKPPDITDKSLDSLETSEILFITGMLIKKVLEKGGVKDREVFKSGDGKIAVCKIRENGWSIKLEKRA